MSTATNNITANGFITFTYHLNNSFAITLNVIKETEKAIQFENEHNAKNIWIPKSCLIFDSKYQVYTVNNWFKDSLKKENNTYKLNALGI